MRVRRGCSSSSSLVSRSCGSNAILCPVPVVACVPLEGPPLALALPLPLPEAWLDPLRAASPGAPMPMPMVEAERTFGLSLLPSSPSSPSLILLLPPPPPPDGDDEATDALPCPRRLLNPSDIGPGSASASASDGYGYGWRVDGMLMTRLTGSCREWAGQHSTLASTGWRGPSSEGRASEGADNWLAGWRAGCAQMDCALLLSMLRQYHTLLCSARMTMGGRETETEATPRLSEGRAGTRRWMDACTDGWMDGWMDARIHWQSMAASSMASPSRTR